MESVTCKRGFSIRPFSLVDFVLTPLMTIDMNGPSDIQAVHELKTLILESVNEWKNKKNRVKSG
jgi:hypothetical protein